MKKCSILPTSEELIRMAGLNKTPEQILKDYRRSKPINKLITRISHGVSEGFWKIARWRMSIFADIANEIFASAIMMAIHMVIAIGIDHQLQKLREVANPSLVSSSLNYYTIFMWVIWMIRLPLSLKKRDAPLIGVAGSIASILLLPILTVVYIFDICLFPFSGKILEKNKQLRLSAKKYARSMLTGEKIKINKTEPILSQTDLVKSVYLQGIERVKERFIGEDSQIQLSARTLERRMGEIDSLSTRAGLRMVDAEDRSQTERYEMLSQDVRDLQGLRDMYEDALVKTRSAIDGVRQLFATCINNVHLLDEPLGDQELHTEIERILLDGYGVAERQQESVEVFLDRLRDTFVRLHAIVSHAALTEHSKDQNLNTYFQEIEGVCNQVNKLQTEIISQKSRESMPLH